MYTVSERTNTKVLVIGLDGGTFELIKQWIAEGMLPQLKSLMENGTCGSLLSTIPFITCPAWSSFKTGMNPGKTGIFDFFARVPNSYETRPHFNTLKGKAIWDILSTRNIPVGVVNVPTTYPPHKIHGIMISGMLTPSQKKTFTYPKELRNSLDKVTDGYMINTDRLEYLDEDEFLRGLYQLTEKRVKAVKYLLKEYDPAFFMVVFVGTDRIQHYFWKYLDKEHPLYDQIKAKKYGDAIKDYWITIDALIGEILESTDDKTYLVFMSDHGFGSQRKNFYVNDWLKEKGFLICREKKKGILSRMRFTRENVKTLLKKIGILKTMRALRISKKLHKMLPKGAHPSFTEMIPWIEWSKTKAYSAQHSFEHIYINVKGRDPQGCVERGEEYELVRSQIIEELLRFGNENSLEMKIHKPEDIYWGSHIRDAPDIIFSINDGECLSIKSFGHTSILEEGSFKKTHTGSHRPHGILILHGSHIRKGYEVSNAEIVDVAPTVLHILGVPVPKDMDGKVLKDVFEEHSELAEKELEYQDADGERERIREKVEALKRRGEV